MNFFKLFSTPFAQGSFTWPYSRLLAQFNAKYTLNKTKLKNLSFFILLTSALLRYWMCKRESRLAQKNGQSTQRKMFFFSTWNVLADIVSKIRINCKQDLSQVNEKQKKVGNPKIFKIFYDINKTSTVPMTVLKMYRAIAPLLATTQHARHQNSVSLRNSIHCESEQWVQFFD